MNGITVQRMKPEHVPVVAQLDGACRPDDFLPALGEGFLRDLYGAFLASGKGFGYVALDGNKIAAFIIGCEDTDELFRTVLRKHRVSLGIRALPRLLTRPSLIGKVIQTFRYPEESSLSEKSELIVMGTDPAYRRRGLGGKLVAALNEEFSSQGVPSYQVTAKERNRGANGFYRSQGFQPRGSFRLYGEMWNRYVMKVPKVH